MSDEGMSVVSDGVINVVSGGVMSVVSDEMTKAGEKNFNVFTRVHC